MFTIKRREQRAHKLPKKMPKLLKQIYSSRGILVEDDLNVDIKSLIPTHQLFGIDSVSIELIDAIKNSKRIVIVGDFDTDGATSSSVMFLGLKLLGAENITYLVPHRITDGYGLSPEVVQQVIDINGEVIVTVDNGISSIEGVDFANQHGVKVIVTDHHLQGDGLPNAAAIVNPNQKKCTFPSKALAGVGVAFYVILHTLNVMKKEGWFTTPPKIGSLLDLVALGTVADVVPLDKNNRILVEHGLNLIRRGKGRPGINALLEVCGKERNKITASDFGFALGPRLNAAGRLDDMSVGVELLIAESDSDAKILALKLDELNKKRRDIENEMKDEALAYCDALELKELPLGIVLSNEKFHQGIIGILASRIKELYFRPVIAFADDGSDVLKGSCRSIPQLNIRDVLDEVDKKEPGIIVKFGGHAAAAGVTINKNKLELFKTTLNKVIRKSLNGQTLDNILYTDGELSFNEFNLRTAKLLREAGPWGQHYPEPMFDNLFLLKEQKLVGEKHLKVTVVPIVDGKELNLELSGIMFNIDLTQWPNKKANLVTIAYKLDINHFRGKDNLQLMITHIEQYKKG